MLYKYYESVKMLSPQRNRPYSHSGHTFKVGSSKSVWIYPIQCLLSCWLIRQQINYSSDCLHLSDFQTWTNLLENGATHPDVRAKWPLCECGQRLGCKNSSSAHAETWRAVPAQACSSWPIRHSFQMEGEQRCCSNRQYEKSEVFLKHKSIKAIFSGLIFRF